MNGHCITIGHRDTGGGFYYLGAYCADWNGFEFHVTRTGVGAPQYNQGFCAYVSGDRSYVNCWTHIL